MRTGSAKSSPLPSASQRLRRCPFVFAHPLGLKPLLASAARLYRAALGPATLVCCAFALPYAAADTAARRLGLSFLDAAQLRGGVQLLLGMAGSVALARLYLQASAARPPGPASLRDALAVAARRWPAGLAIGLVSGLAVGAGSALLVVPGVVVALNLSMALPLLAATGWTRTRCCGARRPWCWVSAGGCCPPSPSPGWRACLWRRCSSRGRTGSSRPCS
jgi:hypothetical protein